LFLDTLRASRFASVPDFAPQSTPARQSLFKMGGAAEGGGKVPLPQDCPAVSTFGNQQDDPPS
jgi:hypothetical protein